MELLPGFTLALIEVNRQVNSARPDAPVAPHVERSRPTYPVRRALAGALYRMAATVAPAERTPAC